MSGGPIIWNAESVLHLSDMIRKAREDGMDEVPFVNGKRSGSHRHRPTHYFSFEEAERLLYDARAELERNPMPVFPENREGKEP